MTLENITLDIDYVRSQFPAFNDPLSKDWSFFENAGGSYVPKNVIDKLTEFMTSGPCMVLALKKEDAVKSWRDTIGATNPDEAADGTIRKEFATSVQENAVHGSDSDENAEKEIAFFFTDSELLTN